MKTLLLATALALGTVMALPALAATDGAAPTTAPAAAATSAASGADAAALASIEPRAKMMFWFLDRNGDGVIDTAEITAYRTARFNSLDANGDGKLTRDEVLAAWKPMPWTHHGKKGQAADAGANGPSDAKKQRFAERMEKRQEKMLERMGFTNGVTEITLAEFLKQPMPLFAKADPNGTGKITEAAFITAFEQGRGHGKGNGPDAN